RSAGSDWRCSELNTRPRIPDAARGCGRRRSGPRPEARLKSSACAGRSCPRAILGDLGFPERPRTMSWSPFRRIDGMDLKNATALITGGSAGVGRAIAASLMGAGARVAITGRDERRLTEAAGSLGAHAIRADV